MATTNQSSTFFNMITSKRSMQLKDSIIHLCTTVTTNLPLSYGRRVKIKRAIGKALTPIYYLRRLNDPERLLVLGLLPEDLVMRF
jgi:hypothetical protein